MTIHDEIARLPEWPKFPPVAGTAGSAAEVRVIGDYHEIALDAARARLALARKWIEGSMFAGHHWLCDMRSGPPSAVCTCGLNALLKAMEVPK